MRQPRQPGLRYVAVAEEITGRIRSGGYPEGSRLPSQHLLAREFGVSLTTLRAAIDLLHEQGFVRSDHGLGTFVTSADGGKATALVVDDDPESVHLLSELLSTVGVSAVGANSRSEAIAKVKQTRFDVIFLDLVMPGGNGLVALKQIRNLGVGTPVVIVTGAADARLVNEAMEFAPLTLIRKPVLVHQVRAAVAHLGLGDPGFAGRRAG